jgi:hypothetical protein
MPCALTIRTLRRKDSLQLSGGTAILLHLSEHKVVISLMVGRTALLRLATTQDAGNIGPAFGHGAVKLKSF